MSLKYNGTTIDSVKYNNTDLTKITYNGTVVWESGPEPLTELCFTSNTNGSTIELCKVGSPSIANTAYSTDRVTWTIFTPSVTQGTNVITLANVGDKVYFRNDITGNFSSSNFLQFKMSGSISASGNCNSMHSSTGFNDLTTLTYEYCLNKLFYNCTSLTTSPVLPATILSKECYYNMFAGCTSLTTAPALPATTLSSWCYEHMFDDCTSLTVAPGLPAVTLAKACYNFMFAGCTSLTTAPALPATTLADYCYNEMFHNCNKLTTPPELPATTLSANCYTGMFAGCTRLQVSDTQTADAQYAWRIPTSGTFTNTYSQYNMFVHCSGTRSSNAMPGEQGQSYIYYTQNPPIGG